MNCETCQQLLPDYALGTLDRSLTEEVTAHVWQSGDPSAVVACVPCRDELQRWQEATSTLAFTVPPTPPPESVKQRLLARVRGEQAPVAPGSLHRSRQADDQQRPAHRSRHRRREVVWYAAATIAAVVAGVAAVHWSDHQAATRAALVQEYEERLEIAGRSFPRKQVSLASFNSAVDQSAIRGYVVWDRISSEAHVFAFDLPPAAPGHTYRFRYLTGDQQWKEGGPLEPRSDGVHATVVKLAVPATEVVRGVITEEPLEVRPEPGGGPPHPDTVRMTADLDLQSRSSE